MEWADRYKIIKKLGTQKKRKFGDVFLVSTIETNQLGVLKFVAKTLDNQKTVERLKHEASFHLDFDGLPKILEVFESEYAFFFVREFKEGIALDTVWNSLSKKKRHPFLVTILEQLAPIFQTLKDQCVVHCDLKPSNLLVSEDGKIHLIDFGLALRTNAIEDRGILFPLGYAAPELLLNRLHLVDERTDYYALGILIWRLYDGKLPLVHPNPSIFTNLQLTHPLPESYEISKKIYATLARLSAKHPFKMPPNKMEISEVDKCLLAGMNLRYSSIELFIQDFKDTAPKSWFRSLSRV